MPSYQPQMLYFVNSELQYLVRDDFFYFFSFQTSSSKYNYGHERPGGVI